MPDINDLVKLRTKNPILFDQYILGNTEFRDKLERRDYNTLNNTSGYNVLKAAKVDDIIRNIGISNNETKQLVENGLNQLDLEHLSNNSESIATGIKDIENRSLLKQVARMVTSVGTASPKSTEIQTFINAQIFANNEAAKGKIETSLNTAEILKPTTYTRLNTEFDLFLTKINGTTARDPGDEGAKKIDRGKEIETAITTFQGVVQRFRKDSTTAMASVVLGKAPTTEPNKKIEDLTSGDSSPTTVTTQREVRSSIPREAPPPAPTASNKEHRELSTEEKIAAGWQEFKGVLMPPLPIPTSLNAEVKALGAEVTGVKKDWIEDPKAPGGQRPPPPPPKVQAR